jgi:phosphonate dehydrogenase
MKSNKIVVTNPIHREVFDRLGQFGQVVMNPSLEPWSQQELTNNLTDATAMMGFMTDCVDKDLLQNTPDLKIVACALKGFDSYDVQACTARNIWVSIVPDLLTEPTAELAIGLAISLGRLMRQGDHLVRSQSFTGWRAQLFGSGLNQSVVSILGLGLVGQAIAQRLAGFGCKSIFGVDPTRSVSGISSVSLEDALAIADYLFVAVPLTERSVNLLSYEQLSQCKKGQLIINVGRGSVVNEGAVADALEKGHLAGYAADVFAFEDWGLNNRPKEIDPKLLKHPNTVFTPHIGSAVKSVRLAIEHRAADNIIAVLRGQSPPDAINVIL